MDIEEIPAPAQRAPNLGKYFAHLPLPNLVIPAGWQISDTGQLLMQVQKKDSKEAKTTEPAEPTFKPVCATTPLIVAAANSAAGQMVKVGWLLHGRWSERWILSSLLNDLRKLGAELRSAGFSPCIESNQRQLANWLGAISNQEPDVFPSSTICSKTGWVDDCKGFLAGPKLLGTTGYALDEGASVAMTVRQSGSRDRSLNAIRTIWDKLPSGRVFILGALAAPLLKPTGCNNFAVCLSGPTSQGKTLSLEAASSLWGTPTTTLDKPFLTTWSGTPVAIEGRASQLSDVPLCLDETKHMFAADREALVYQITSGQGKERGKKDGGNRLTSTFRTIILAAGEQPLVDESTAARGAQTRVLECPHFHDVLDYEDVTAIKQDEENYGFLGPEFVQYVIPRSSEIRCLWKSKAKELEQACKTDIDRRRAPYIALLATTESLVAQLWGFDISTSIVERFRRNNEPTLTELERGLDVLAQAYERDRSKFLVPGQERPREVVGYIRPDCIAFLPFYFEDLLNKAGIAPKMFARLARAADHMRTEKPDELKLRIVADNTKVQVYAIFSESLGVNTPKIEKTVKKDLLS